MFVYFQLSDATEHQYSGVASIGPGRAFTRPLTRQVEICGVKNNIHSKEEEQEEPKSLPPDAFPWLQICQNCFCGRRSVPDPTGGA